MLKNVLFVVLALTAAASVPPDLQIKTRYASQGLIASLSWEPVPFAFCYDLYETKQLDSPPSLLARNVQSPVDVRIHMFGQGNPITRFFQLQAHVIQADAAYFFNGNTLDETGNGNHGINHGASFAPDRFSRQNSALYFDGESDYVQLLHPIQYDNLTVSHWFCLDSTAETQMSMVRHRTNGFHTVFLVDDEDDDLHLFTDVWLENQGDRYIYYSETAQRRMKWHHVAITYDGTLFCTYYDGLLIYSSSELGPERPIVYGNHVTVFGRDGDVNNRYFKGWLDDVLFFQRALTAEEILLIFRSRDNQN